MVTSTRVSHGVTYEESLDTDTAQRGIEPPFEAWEGDHTALMHVLWSAEGDGLIAGRPDHGLALERALFDRMFAPENRGVAGARARLIGDLRAILDAFDPEVTPGAPGADRVDREALTDEQRHEGSAVDATASMILRSRWLAATRAEAAGEAARR